MSSNVQTKSVKKVICRGTECCNVLKTIDARASANLQLESCSRFITHVCERYSNKTSQHWNLRAAKENKRTKSPRNSITTKNNTI